MISQWLATHGLLAARTDCPGPNVVDHMELDITEEITSGFDKPGRTIRARLVEREEVCHNEEPEFRTGESLVKVITNDEGREWSRAITAATHDAGAFFAAGSLDEAEDDPNIRYIELIPRDSERS